MEGAAGQLDRSSCHSPNPKYRRSLIRGKVARELEYCFRRRQILNYASCFDLRALQIELGARNLDPIFLEAQEQVDIRVEWRDPARTKSQRLHRELAFV